MSLCLRIGAVCMTLVAAGFLFLADPARGEVLTLADCLALAQERSLSVLGAEADVEAAQHRLKAVRAAFYPVVSTSYGYAMVQPVQTMDLGFTEMSLSERDNFAWSLSVGQPIFTGFALSAAKKLEELSLEIGQSAVDLARLDLALKVKGAYFNVLLAEKGRVVAQQAVQLLEAQVETAQSFFEVGLIPKNDLLQVQVQLADRRLTLTTAKGGQLLAKAALNTLLRRPVEAELSVEDILEVDPIRPDFQTSLDLALRRRPEVKQALKAIEAAEETVRLARADLYPDAALQASYERSSPGLFTNLFDDSSDYETTTISLGLSWDLWTWGKVRHEVSAKKAGIIKARYTLDQVKDLIALEIKEALLNLASAEEKIEVVRLAVLQAEEGFRMSEERFKEQVTTSTEVLDAQTSLTNAQRNYYATLYGYHLAMSAFKRALGER
ncbi:MAG: TolC family protein [Deltaproteobacteria bacterium]|nr:TolC family protein [Deltaproteobacteria bacterium]